MRTNTASLPTLATRFEIFCDSRQAQRRFGEATAKHKMKVKFTAYHAVAEWKWDLPDDSDDTCGICRVQFEGTCAKCKYPGDDCPITRASVQCVDRSSRKRLPTRRRQRESPVAPEKRIYQHRMRVQRPT
nr:anaphase-promoting complex subunit 11 [Quercus suber]